MRGYPDYNNPSYSLAAKNIDFSQLVLVNSGLVSVDGLGRVITAENWREGPTHFTITATGTATAFHASLEAAEIPPVSLKGVSGKNTDGGLTQAIRIYQLNAPGRMGVQAALGYSVDGPNYALNLSWSTDADSWLADFQLNAKTGVVSLRDATGLHAFLTLPNTGSTIRWLPVKFVVDFELAEWVSLILGQNFYDLSGMTLNHSTPIIVQGVELTLAITAIDGTNRTGYFGHLIITTDEP